MSSVDLRTLEIVEAAVEESNNVMVILDSDHSQPHVLKELNVYSKYVTPGCYLVVEDTNPDGYHNPAGSTYDPQVGYAGHAVRAWKPERHGFRVDERCERFLFTQNPGGWLLKEKPKEEK
jgi:cephalosporin hydroxylase